MSLLLPAVQVARENARQVTCSNRIRQLALACIEHEEAHGHLPVDGWGYKWIGDPDQGFGREQPGGWAYNVLPFIEQKSLHDLGMGDGGTEKTEAFRKLLTTPVPLFFCPSRRPPALYAQRPSWEYNHPDDPGYITPVVKGDYAINRGTVDIPNTFHPGPGTMGAFANHNFPNPATCTGLAWWATEFPTSKVQDGLTNTVLLGEKGFSYDNYEVWEAGDPQNLYIGHDPDNSRLGGPAFPLIKDITRSEYLNSTLHYNYFYTFGGPHANGCNFAFVDGRVRSIGWNMNLETLAQLCHRNDGTAILDPDFE